MVKKLSQYVKPFSSDTGTSRTDGRTDGRTDRQTDRFAISISRVSVLTRYKNRRKRNRSCWISSDWIARRPTINVGNFTTKCHSFAEKTAKKTSKKNLKSGLSADIVGSRDTRADIVGRQTKNHCNAMLFLLNILRLSRHELVVRLRRRRSSTCA